MRITNAREAEGYAKLMRDQREQKVWEVGGGWGDCISIMSSDNLSVDGTMKGYGFKEFYPPKVDDLLHCKMKSGRTAIFKFTEIKKELDPRDMFFWKAEFTGDFAE